MFQCVISSVNLFKLWYECMCRFFMFWFNNVHLNCDSVNPLCFFYQSHSLWNKRMRQYGMICLLSKKRSSRNIAGSIILCYNYKSYYYYTIFTSTHVCASRTCMPWDKIFDNSRAPGRPPESASRATQCACAPDLQFRGLRFPVRFAAGCCWWDFPSPFLSHAGWQGNMEKMGKVAAAKPGDVALVFPT